ncbi:unnamed protein product, partial [Ceratitis capitata]
MGQLACKRNLRMFHIIGNLIAHKITNNHSCTHHSIHFHTLPPSLSTFHHWLLLAISMFRRVQQDARLG